MNYTHQLYEFYYPDKKVRQQKVLIPHVLYIRIMDLPIEDQDEELLKLSGGKEWFTDRSPLFDSITAGVLSCNGVHKCIVKHILHKDYNYELQKIDCNCNDCLFLERDFDKYKAVVEQDKVDQLWLFGVNKDIAIRKAKKKMERDKEKGQIALAAALAKTHSYQGTTNPDAYGRCKKFDKPISFHPGTCQLHTQQCFAHRKDQIQ